MYLLKPLYRFLLLLIFSLFLMMADHRHHSGWLTSVRTFASVINLPFQMLRNLPTTTYQFIKKYYPDDDLHRKYTALVKKQLALEVDLQRFVALQSENERLLKLLSVSRKAAVPGLIAEIVEIGLQPFTHQVAINRGVEAGVYLTQPVFTSRGVLGQVSEVGVKHSVITLLTSPSHAIPVQVQRNGLRTIVQGNGDFVQLDAPFLPGHSDIRVADILLTSGVGGTFPAGFKVAQVEKVITDANQALLTVHSSMFANADRVREVLLLRHKTDARQKYNSTEPKPTSE